LQPYPRLGEQSHQQHLAALDRFAPQVLPIEFKQIEGAQHNVLVIAALAQLVEHRHALVIATDRLAVDQAGAHSQCRYSLVDQREAFGPVVPIASEKAHACGPTPR